MKHILLVGLSLFASASYANEFGRPPAEDPVGRYSGSCQTFYKDAPPGYCNVTMDVNTSYGVIVYADGACSPTNYQGILSGNYVELRSGGWRAQPRGQYLQLTFQQTGRSWGASGSGYGLSDANYKFNCSFRKP